MTQFGNWIVTESNIRWNGDNSNQLAIAAGQLVEVRHSFIGKEIYYQCILSATDEEWLTQNDLYDLNYAFVYAVAKFGLDFNYEIFDATLEQQYDQFDAEDEDDEGEA
jgi:hypothetical protein